ncbi:hypothetical protein [Clostridium beijerinckii]|uniref:hypothetical protein n=1 Tax=Clostridium beijerinckii TaxID=1520 RepID=UPI00242C50C4|nr:hypothetical protein [Clostridium beijerinckii]MDG5857072.1 hypothetical protein [Clostridium beijerinckii]
MLDIFKDIEKDLITIRDNSKFWDKRKVNTFLKNLNSIHYIPCTERLRLCDRWYLDTIDSYIFEKLGVRER